MTARRTNVSTAVTLRDVARAAGVHPGTASRALNVETRPLVNEETAQRVLKAAEELGYHPNPIARGLKTNRSYTIGVLIPDLTNPLFPPILRGIEDRLDEAGYTALIANTDNDPDRERMDWRAMLARQVDGIIAATARRNHELLDEIAARLRLVLVNRRADGAPISAATGEDRRGIGLAVEHLAGLGHRRIAHVAGPRDISTGYDRHEGYLEGLARAGLEANREDVVVTEAFTEEHGARACRRLLENGSPATAIAAGNDLLALGCYDVLAERGLRCPQDISVVGFNDMPFADRFQPPLTTIRIPHYDIGATAAELMLELLANPEAPPRDVALPAELIVRGSTAPTAA